jgi:hypothetical protein
MAHCGVVDYGAWPNAGIQIYEVILLVVGVSLAVYGEVEEHHRIVDIASASR